MLKTTQSAMAVVLCFVVEEMGECVGYLHGHSGLHVHERFDDVGGGVQDVD